MWSIDTAKQAWIRKQKDLSDWPEWEGDADNLELSNTIIDSKDLWIDIWFVQARWQYLKAFQGHEADSIAYYKFESLYKRYIRAIVDRPDWKSTDRPVNWRVVEGYKGQEKPIQELIEELIGLERPVEKSMEESVSQELIKQPADKLMGLSRPVDQVMEGKSTEGFTDQEEEEERPCRRRNTKANRRRRQKVIQATREQIERHLRSWSAIAGERKLRPLRENRFRPLTVDDYLNATELD
ncbi:hypothetical protein B7463_g8860, partial [Scytalidium lignicola]